MKLGIIALISFVIIGGCAEAIPTPNTQSCIQKYQACASEFLNNQIDEANYVACRDSVDKDCLPGMFGDGGVKIDGGNGQ